MKLIHFKSDTEILQFQYTNFLHSNRVPQLGSRKKIGVAFKFVFKSKRCYDTPLLFAGFVKTLSHSSSCFLYMQMCREDIFSMEQIRLACGIKYCFILREIVISDRLWWTVLALCSWWWVAMYWYLHCTDFRHSIVHRFSLSQLPATNLSLLLIREFAKCVKALHSVFFTLTSPVIS